MEEEFIDQPSMFDMPQAGGPEPEPTITKEMVTEAIDTKETLGSLVNGPGWGFIKEAAAAQVAQRMLQLRTPVETTEELIKKEILLSEINGIELFVQLPQMLVDNANEILELYDAQSEGKENTDG